MLNAKTKPLGDPLRILSRITGWGAPLLIFAGMYLFIAADGPASPERADGFARAAKVMATGFFLLSVWAVARPRREANAFYLRAFAEDDQSMKLRTSLARALGKEFRLGGIRPPGQRSSTFVRALTNGLVILRYVGSGQMDLEAGNDWIARLLVSLTKAEVAFIDVRTMTPHLRDEIKLSVLQLKLDRCIFIVSRRLNAVEEAKELLDALDLAIDPAIDPAKLLWVVYQEGDLTAFQNDVRKIVDGLPKPCSRLEPEAIRLVDSLLDVAPPDTSRKNGPAVQILSAFVLLPFTAMVLEALWGKGWLVYVLMAPVQISVWIFYMKAVFRTFASGARERGFQSLLFAGLGALVYFSAPE
ncbi:MAG: hypothetical protein ABJF10_17360 [Chthoniobacter sp.]|uniref:hypothetical protein n=1 Tax=Chthoniobacter sp. TaxID=2510640 RepID=UPI0032A16C4D